MSGFVILTDFVIMLAVAYCNLNTSRFLAARNSTAWSHPALLIHSVFAT